MARRLISSGSRFEREYGYSRAIVQGPWVFVSGTTGYDYASMAMPADVVAQTRASWATIEAVLQEAGASLSDIVRCRYYVVDRADADAMLRVCGEVLGEVRPAATLAVAQLLTPEIKVEIEVTALRASG
jgi:enamine deaminase RidA (YjgF/YER057c/UK114 family)